MHAHTYMHTHTQPQTHIYLQTKTYKTLEDIPGITRDEMTCPQEEVWPDVTQSNVSI